MLYGRREECVAVDRLLEAARSGRSRVLVLRGEAGIGKSTLLAYAAERAQGTLDGIAVLRASGIESEVELPFAALHQLLRPLLDRVDRLPAPQSAALNGTFGMAPASGDRFLLSVGVLSLLAEAAEEGAGLPHPTRWCSSPGGWPPRGSCCCSRPASQSGGGSTPPGCRSYN